MHIETINPMERLSPELGGTGYVPPNKPASAFELYHDAQYSLSRFPGLNFTVWKVARESVNWKRHAKFRRLIVSGKPLQASVIGGTEHWWFVSVDATVVVRQLAGSPAPPAGESS